MNALFPVSRSFSRVRAGRMQVRLHSAYLLHARRRGRVNELQEGPRPVPTPMPRSGICGGSCVDIDAAEAPGTASRRLSGRGHAGGRREVEVALDERGAPRAVEPLHLANREVAHLVSTPRTSPNASPVSGSYSVRYQSRPPTGTNRWTAASGASHSSVAPSAGIVAAASSRMSLSCISFSSLASAPAGCKRACLRSARRRSAGEGRVKELAKRPRSLPPPAPCAGAAEGLCGPLTRRRPARQPRGARAGRVDSPTRAVCRAMSKYAEIREYCFQQTRNRIAVHPSASIQSAGKEGSRHAGKHSVHQGRPRRVRALRPGEKLPAIR